MNAKIRFRRKFPSKCNKPIVKWYKPHGAIHPAFGKNKIAHAQRNCRLNLPKELKRTMRVNRASRRKVLLTSAKRQGKLKFEM